MSQFSQELFKLQSSNMAYIRKMSDCIMGTRLRLISLTPSLFLHISFHILHVNIKNLCQRSLRNYLS